jgi:hypothetical protein
MWLVILGILFVVALIVVPGIVGGDDVYEERDENPMGL